MQAELVAQRLNMTDPTVAFGGSLLAHDNALSDTLVRRLHLPCRPIAQHEPVIGAALLAKIHTESEVTRT